MNKKEKKGKYLAPEAETPKKKKHGWRNFFIVILALCIVALAIRIYIRPPDSDHQLAVPPGGKTSLPAGQTNPSGSGGKARNVYTCLLLGQRDGMTDTIMVAMLDLDAKTAGVISIPRDTVADVSRRVPKINGAYGNGGGGTDGVEQMLEELSTIIGYKPSNYCMVNMKAFVEIVDAMGGVDFDVPVRMYKQYEGINLQPGMQHLDGNKALQLVRFRGYGQSAAQAGIDHDDYGRMQVQQMFLKAMVQQALTLGNIKNIPTMIESVGKNLITDMDAGNIAWYGEQILKLGGDSISFATLPTTSINYGNSNIAKGYYEVIDSAAALEMINEYINPFNFEITDSMVSHVDPRS